MGVKEVAGKLPDKKIWGLVKATSHKTSASPDAAGTEKSLTLYKINTDNLRLK